MTRLLLGNVVSDAYFEVPAELADGLQRRGDHLGYRMLWLARPEDVVVLGACPSEPFLSAAHAVLGFQPEVVVVPRRRGETLPEAAARDPTTLARLRTLRAAVVLPYAASVDVCRLAELIGCRVDGPLRRFVGA